MDMINRSALLVKPGQPFLDWLRRVDRTSAELTLGDLRREPTIYLLPEWETEEEALQHLAAVCSETFEEQLNGWYRVPTAWPEDRELHGFFPGSTAVSILWSRISVTNSYSTQTCNARPFESDYWTLRATAVRRTLGTIGKLLRRSGLTVPTDGLGRMRQAEIGLNGPFARSISIATDPFHHEAGTKAALTSPKILTQDSIAPE